MLKKFPLGMFKIEGEDIELNLETYTTSNEDCNKIIAHIYLPKHYPETEVKKKYYTENKKSNHGILQIS